MEFGKSAVQKLNYFYSHQSIFLNHKVYLSCRPDRLSTTRTSI